MRFLSIRETNDLRYLAKSVEIFFRLSPANTILLSSENHVWAYYTNFGSLKICFLLIRETNV